MKRGIDISYHQGNVNFEEIKKGGIEFVILRSSYRNSVDKKFSEYVLGAKFYGIPIKGIYHFSYPLKHSDVIEEANLSVSLAKKAGLSPEEIVIFYDFEYDTVKKAADKGVTLTKKECNEFTLAFCKEVERLGYKAGIYTNLDYYKNWYEKSVLSSFRVWLADYTNGPDFPCLVQQYSSTGSVPGIKGNVDLDYWYDEKPTKKEDFKIKEDLRKMRQKAIDLFCSWVGKNEKDGSYKEIIDIYNSNKPYPRNTKMQYGWPWCACTWSAVAIKLGITNIMPIEVSCGELIKKAKEMGIWVEEDGYIPLPGDGILYDWDCDSSEDCSHWPDHIGMVVSIDKKARKFKVVEGNKNDAVGYRLVPFNYKFTRGFITPKYEGEKAEVPKPSSTVKEKPEKRRSAEVITHALNIRQTPPNGAVMRTVTRGTQLDLTGKTKKIEDVIWYEVECFGTTGWCSGNPKYLRVE